MNWAVGLVASGDHVSGILKLLLYEPSIVLGGEAVTLAGIAGGDALAGVLLIVLGSGPNLAGGMASGLTGGLVRGVLGAVPNDGCCGGGSSGQGVVSNGLRALSGLLGRYW